MNSPNTIEELKKREDSLTDEQFSLEWDIIETLDYLIHAEWDSNTLKQKLEKMNKEHDRVINELREIWRKQEELKK